MKTSTMRVRSYPASFLVRHPVRAARNVVGNRPSSHADHYLKGLRGVEIGGAAHNDFFLNTINVDITPVPSTAAAQLTYSGSVMPVDVVAPADRLPFPDAAYDFVLGSHVLEHVPDPIQALHEWTRVASRFLYIILPSRDNPYDAGKPLTTIEDLEARHRARFASDQDRHWSVWTSDTFVSLCGHLGLDVIDVEDPDDKRANGFAVVIATRRPTA